jgi:hypothetical protein
MQGFFCFREFTCKISSGLFLAYEMPVNLHFGSAKGNDWLPPRLAR